MKLKYQAQSAYFLLFKTSFSSHKSLSLYILCKPRSNFFSKCQHLESCWPQLRATNASHWEDRKCIKPQNHPQCIWHAVSILLDNKYWRLPRNNPQHNQSSQIEKWLQSIYIKAWSSISWGHTTYLSCARDVSKRMPPKIVESIAISISISTSLHLINDVR